MRMAISMMVISLKVRSMAEVFFPTQREKSIKEDSNTIKKQIVNV